MLMQPPTGPVGEIYPCSHCFGSGPGHHQTQGAVSEASKEALYLREYLAELGELDRDGEPTQLSVDNTAARDVAYNPEHHGRIKHIKRRHHFVRECIENMETRVPFVATHDNIADFFTKSLSSSQFFAIRDQIMNVKMRPSRSPGGAV